MGQAASGPGQVTEPQTGEQAELLPPHSLLQAPVHFGVSLLQLACHSCFFFFFFLIALRFWLRIILGSLENKDKSDLPCIPKGIGNWRDSLLFHFQTNLELKVLLVGFQSLFYGDAVMLRQPEKVTIPFFSALQASMFKSSFSLWPSTNWLCDVGSVASYVNRVRSEWSPRFLLALSLWSLPGLFSVIVMTYSWRCRFTWWLFLFLYHPHLIVFLQDM